MRHFLNEFFFRIFSKLKSEAIQTAGKMMKNRALKLKTGLPGKAGCRVSERSG
jgi:hypothetical protein